MNKAELIAQLAEDAGITKVQANAALDSFVDTVTKTLKKGDKKLVKVSINTRKTSDTLYTSEFATDFILVD